MDTYTVDPSPAYRVHAAYFHRADYERERTEVQSMPSLSADEALADAAETFPYLIGEGHPPMQQWILDRFEVRVEHAVYRVKE